MSDQVDAMPDDLLHALNMGHLTHEQLIQLVTLEAATLGMCFKCAVRAARNGTLPKTVIGLDIELLVLLL